MSYEEKERDLIEQKEKYLKKYSEQKKNMVIQADKAFADISDTINSIKKKYFEDEE